MAKSSDNGNPRKFPLWEKMRMINATELSTAEKMVLLVLADFGGQDGVAFPTQATIAQQASISERQLRRIVQTLEKKKLVSLESRGRGTLYQIIWKNVKRTSCPVLGDDDTGHHVRSTPDMVTGTPDTMSGQHRTPCPTNIEENREGTEKRTKNTKKNTHPPPPAKSENRGGGVFSKISEEELSNPEAVQDWITQNLTQPISEHVRQNVLGCANRAMRIGDNPPALFKSLVRDGLAGHWRISDEDLPGGYVSRNMREFAKAIAEAEEREATERESQPKLISECLNEAAEIGDFWEASPKKENRGQIEALWAMAKRKAESSKHKTADETAAEFLTRRMYDYAASVAMEDFRFTKTPANWLKDLCWENELPDRVPTDEDLRNWTPQ